MSEEPPPCPFAKQFPSELERDDRYFMRHAWNLALEGWACNEVPVGAVVAVDGQIIGRGFNQTRTTGDPTAHAEIVAIGQAARALGDWRLNAAALYVTKEPCPMCAGATIMARLGRVVFGVPDPKMGCLGGAIDLNEPPGFNHRTEVTQGVLGAECHQLLQAFFRPRRSKNNGQVVDETEPG